MGQETEESSLVVVSVGDLDTLQCAWWLKALKERGVDFAWFVIQQGESPATEMRKDIRSKLANSLGRSSRETKPASLLSSMSVYLVGDFAPAVPQYLEALGGRCERLCWTDHPSRLEALAEWLKAHGLAGKGFCPSENALLMARAAHCDRDGWLTAKRDFRKYRSARELDAAIRQTVAGLPELLHRLAEKICTPVNGKEDAKHEDFCNSLRVLLHEASAKGQNRLGDALKYAKLTVVSPLPVRLTTRRSAAAGTFGPVLDLGIVKVGHLPWVLDAWEIEKADSGPSAAMAPFDPKLKIERSVLILGIEAERYPRLINNGSLRAVRKLAFYGPRTLVEEVRVLAEGAGLVVEEDARRQRAAMPGIFISAEADRPFASAFSASAGETDRLSAFADQIIDSVLSGNRPVERLRTHFFAAFDDPERDCIRLTRRHWYFPGWPRVSPDRREQTLANSTNEERAYFLPELRGRLFGDADPSPLAVRSFEIPLGADLRLVLDHGNYDVPIDFSLAGAWLHFCGGVVLLEWVVEHEAERSCEQERQADVTAQFEAITKQPEEWHEGDPVSTMERSSRSLWTQLLNRETPSLTLAQAIDFNAESRFTHHTYPRLATDRGGRMKSAVLSLAAKGEEKARLVFSAPASGPGGTMTVEKRKPVVAWLLSRALGAGGRRLLSSQLSDDRARVLTSLVLFGNPGKAPSARDAQEIALSLVSVVDPYGTGFPYDEGVSREELRASLYRRFASLGSNILVTEHSMSFISWRGGNRPPSDWPGHAEAAPARFGFAEHFIHPDHMNGVYRRMFMHFLFLEAELRSISRQLVELENARGDERRAIGHATRSAVADLRQRMTLAASSLRQTMLSTQLQGRELTEKLAERFRLDREWDALDRKVGALERMVEDEYARTDTMRLGVLYYLGIPFIIAGFIATAHPGKPADTESALAALYWPVAWIASVLPAGMGSEVREAIAFFAVVAGVSAAVFVFANRISCHLRGLTRSSGRFWDWLLRRFE